MEEGHEIAVIAMDQSAAYDLIDHQILLKMTILGFDKKNTDWFQNYLNNRQHKVYIDGAWSDTLHVGGKSVIQGSVLSCALYLIYVMDIPLLFHGQ